MSWQELRGFHDAAVPKLNNLRRASEAGLRVPPTWWASARDAPGLTAPPPGIDLPLIVRSASPTEDSRTTSNAGKFLSLVVRDAAEFAEAVRRVATGLPGGAVFVQPVVAAIEGGVAFYDGFYYERTTAPGGNRALTAGQERGEVRRGHHEPDEAWSVWLRAVYAVFGAAAGGDERLDLEFARDALGYVLFQVRPALFPVVRNPTLTRANVQETFGDRITPWSVSSVVAAGRDGAFVKVIEPAFVRWQEPFAREACGQLWINLTLFYRWADHLGVPRDFIVRSLGGDLADASAGQPPLRILWRALPQIARGFRHALQKLAEVRVIFRRLDRTIEAAEGLDGLYRATVAGWRAGIDTALGIAGMLAVLARLRAILRLPSAARILTKEMMDDYSRLAALPDRAQREAGLDTWLRRYGHRGPRESDIGQPRFAELREVLLQDLLAAQPPAAPSAPVPWGLRRLIRPLHCMEEFREWARDAFMKRWQRLRQRLLEEGARLVAAGQLDAPDDVFWLRDTDWHGPTPLREVVGAAKERHRIAASLCFPMTASFDELEAMMTKAEGVREKPVDRDVFPGIALGPAVVEGRAVRADDLTDLLVAASREALLDLDAILVVPSLEPSWAVVFPRVGGVVAELGGELSHASILLREARKPAVVNCRGICACVKTGDRLRLDGRRGVVERQLLAPSSPVVT
jgi:pyruvate,water dikinase